MFNDTVRSFSGRVDSGTKANDAAPVETGSRSQKLVGYPRIEQTSAGRSL
jgi:hypothetical protein